MGMEDDFLLEDEDDQKTIEFIKNYLPQDLKDKFTEDDLYYILDVIVDYYTSSGCLDVQPDEEGYINIDQDEIVNYIVKEAKKDGMGPYDPDDVFFVVKGNGIWEFIGTSGLRRKSHNKIKDAYLYVGDAHFFILENKVVSTISSLISFVKENNRIPL